MVSISIGSTVNKAKNSFQYGVTSKMYLSQLGFTFLIQLMGCVASYMVVTVIAFFLDTVGMYELSKNIVIRGLCLLQSSSKNSSKFAIIF